MNENREYKSDVFSMLMENKSYALEVYNALNHSDYRKRDMALEEAVDRAIEDCIGNHVLEDFFRNRSAGSRNSMPRNIRQMRYALH